jgi:Tol biopolymer transport system component
MTTDDTFGRDLSRWLQDEAEHRVPDHLAEVLVQTVATRQRPWWSSLERWLPMETVVSRRPLNVRPVAVALLVLGALLLAVVAVMWVAGQRQTPLALAANGRIFVIDGQTLKSYAATGVEPQVALNLPASAKAPSISPDGRSIAYILDALARLDILNVENGTTRTIPLGVAGVGGPISWSPDGATLLFNTFDGAHEHLVTAKADGSDVSEIDVSAATSGDGGATADAHVELWPAGWSPTGDRVAFVKAVLGDDEGTLYVVRPDGSDLQAVGPERVWTYSVSWSPDPTVDRLILTSDSGAGGVVQILDLLSGDMTDVSPGFWPTWSPDGSRIAYWNDGTVVVDTAGTLAGTLVEVRPYPPLAGACDQHVDRADQAYCGPAAWSPDGQRLLAPDITGRSIVSLTPDGSGPRIVIPLESTSSGEASAAWQPIPR